MRRSDVLLLGSFWRVLLFHGIEVQRPVLLFHGIEVQFMMSRIAKLTKRTILKQIPHLQGLYGEFGNCDNTDPYLSKTAPLRSYSVLCVLR
jgi:hypothetical protein